MSFRLFLAAALLSMGFAGCLTEPAPASTTDAAVQKVVDLLAGPSIWPDPQNFPHPGFNWPTLSSPAGPDAPSWWQPINATPLPAVVRGLELTGKSSDIAQGAGIAVFGGLAVVPEDGKQAYVVDIRDPTAPKVLSTFGTGGRGAAIIAYPNGRLVTVLASTRTIDVADITDPYNPELLEPLNPKQGSHKLGVVPGTPIVYNAASVGGNSNGIIGPAQVSPTLGETFTEIFDLTDPDKPVHVQDWKNGYSCHHIFFWNSPDGTKQRAICAGIEYTQLWDTADPRHPKVIVSIPVHYGVANGPSGAAFIEAFSHSAGINIKGNILYVGDENGGGGIPPGCVAEARTPAGSVGTPIGATWFYDIGDEKNPRLLGYYTPNNDPTTKNPLQSCTTHHGRIVPVPGRDLLAMSYYGAGVIVVDFTGIGTPNGPLPKVVAQFVDKSDTWETWYNQGYLFTGDLSHGMDVLKFK